MKTYITKKLFPFSLFALLLLITLASWGRIRSSSSFPSGSTEITPASPIKLESRKELAEFSQLGDSKGRCRPFPLFQYYPLLNPDRAILVFRTRNHGQCYEATRLEAVAPSGLGIVLIKPIGRGDKNKVEHPCPGSRFNEWQRITSFSRLDPSAFELCRG